MHRKAAAILFGTVFGITAAATPAQSDPIDEMGTWAQFKSVEKSLHKETEAQTQEPRPEPNTSGAQSYAPSTVQQGAFTVPGYFAVQPQPYQRPQETFATPSTKFDTTGSGSSAFASTLPFVLSGGTPWGYGYGPYGWGGLGYGAGNPGAFMGLPSRAWSAGVPGFGFGGYGPGFGGYGLPGIGFGGIGLPGIGFGGIGLPGIGFGGIGLPGIGFGGYGPGLGYGGYGGYGWYGNPGFGSLMMGAFAGRITGSSNLGGLNHTRVFQSAPSKPSGNYYAPSTIDTTASGSYYATTSPAQIPSMPVQKPITNFWNAGGDPNAKDNSMPWNK